MIAPRQGDIIKINGIKSDVLVVSRDFFNNEGEILACPVVECCTAGPLHIEITLNDKKMYVLCEKLVHLDIKVRGFSYVQSLEMRDIINITDAIQGIFDYI